MTSGIPDPLLDTDIADLVRSEILAGRGLIALDQSGRIGACRLYAIVREAAFVTGRMADLVVIDFDPDGMGRRTEPSAHRIDLGSLRPDSSRKVLAGSRKKLRDLGTWRRDVGAFDERRTNPHPTFDVRDVSRRNRILVLRGVETRIMDVGSAAIWIIRDEARARKADMPLVVAAQVDLAPAAKLLGWVGLQGRQVPPMVGKAHLSAMATATVLERTLHGRVGQGEWAGRVRASVPVPRKDVPLGIVVMEEGGRTVMAMGWDQGNGVTYACVDAQADGWCHAAWFAVQKEPIAASGDTMALRAARAVWCGGTRGLAYGAGLKHLSYVEHPDELSLPEGRLGDAFRSILSRVHAPDLQRACLMADEPGKVHARITGDGRVQEWRRQFALAMPALADLLLEPRFAPVVDAGQETLPAVASWFGTSLPIARRMVGRWLLPYPGNCRTVAETHEHAGRFLTMLGVGSLPQDESGWDAMYECARKSFNLFSYSETYRGGALDHCVRLLKGIPGGWVARKQALSGYSETDVMSVIDMVREYQDLLHRLDPRVPGLTRSGNVYDEVGLPLMAMHGNLVRLLDASARWHADPVLSRTDGGVTPDATWPVPFDVHGVGGGWEAICLGSVKALVDEGCTGADRNGLDGLDHCVATYAPTCRAGYSLIVSLRHEGVRMATVELVADEVGTTRFRFGDVGLWLRQCSGRRNKTPPAGTIEALKRLRSDLEDGRIAIDAEALVPRPSAESPEIPVAFVRERLELWRPYLPRALARKTHEVQIQAALTALETSGLRLRANGRWE